MQAAEIESFTRAELEQAFNLVADPEHWKNPIHKVLPSLDARERERIERAVVFFAGCKPTFKDLGAAGVLVTAPGYYLAVGS